MSSRAWRFVGNAARVVAENPFALDGFAFQAQGFGILSDLRRRHAPGFCRFQNRLLLFVGYSGPEFLRQRFGVRLHVDSGTCELFLIYPEDFAQPIQFLVHVAEELRGRRFYLHVAALVAFECEANRDVFGKLQKRRLRWRILLALARPEPKVPGLTVKSRATGESREPRLKGTWIDLCSIARASHLRENLQDSLQLVLVHGHQPGFHCHGAGAALRGSARSNAFGRAAVPAAWCVRTARTVWC